jgi:acyl-CoA thioesterase-2
MNNSKELIELLDLKEIEKNVFSGERVTIGSPKVFGGQV